MFLSRRTKRKLDSDWASRFSREAVARDANIIRNRPYSVALPVSEDEIILSTDDEDEEQSSPRSSLSESINQIQLETVKDLKPDDTQPPTPPQSGSDESEVVEIVPNVDETKRRDFHLPRDQDTRKRRRNGPMRPSLAVFEQAKNIRGVHKITEKEGHEARQKGETTTDAALFMEIDRNANLLNPFYEVFNTYINAIEEGGAEDYDSDEIEEFAKHENSRLSCFYAYGMNQWQSNDNSMYSKHGLILKADRCLMDDFEELIVSKDAAGIASKLHRVIDAFAEHPKTGTNFQRRLFRQIFNFCEPGFVINVLEHAQEMMDTDGEKRRFKKVLRALYPVIEESFSTNLRCLEMTAAIARRFESDVYNELLKTMLYKTQFSKDPMKSLTILRTYRTTFSKIDTKRTEILINSFCMPDNNSDQPWASDIDRSVKKHAVQKHIQPVQTPDSSTDSSLTASPSKSEIDHYDEVICLD